MGYTKGLLAKAQQLGRDVQVGVVGAGQMGTGLVSAICNSPGMTVAAVADIEIERAQAALKHAGKTKITTATGDLSAAIKAINAGGCAAINDGLKMPQLPVDIVVEVSGVPEVAAQIAYSCITNRKDVALMTVEADITVGVLLSSLANAAGCIYTVMRGDEPVECLKLVEYAEDLGLEVICAGKGKNNVNIPTSVPADNMAAAQAKGMNPRMLTEFTDGTKTQVEMAALSNATGLPIEVSGMHGLACDLKDLATTLIPKADGGQLDFDKGAVVEYVTGDVAPGVFVIVKSNNDVVTAELDYLRLGTGPYYVFYRPYHIASIEAPLSIGEAVLYRQPDFQSRYFCTEVVGRAKFDLESGITLEGMGGTHYYGWAVDAQEAKEQRAVPIGLLQKCKLINAKQQGEIITYDDIQIDETRPLVAMRRLQDSLVANKVLGAAMG